MLEKLSSLTVWWSILWNWASGLDWKSWATPEGLKEDGGKWALLFGWEDSGLSICGALEMSSLVSELFSLLLLLEPSVSLLRLIDSVGSLFFSACIYIHWMNFQDSSRVFFFKIQDKVNAREKESFLNKIGGLKTFQFWEFVLRNWKMRKGDAKQRGKWTQQIVGQSHHGHHCHHTALALAKVDSSTSHLKIETVLEMYIAGPKAYNLVFWLSSVSERVYAHNDSN